MQVAFSQLCRSALAASAASRRAPSTVAAAPTAAAPLAASSRRAAHTAAVLAAAVVVAPSPRSSTAAATRRRVFAAQQLQRSFGATAAPLGRRMVGTSLKATLDSLQVIADPVLPPQPPLKPLTMPWLRHQRRVLRGKMTTWYSYFQLRQRIKDFRTPAFLLLARTMFREMNEALASGDGTELRSIVTESFYSTLKPQLEQIKKRDLETKWECTFHKVQLAALRHIPLAELGQEWTQACVRVKSTQTLTVTQRGKQVSNKSVDLDEIWAYERRIHPNLTAWRIVGRAQHDNVVGEE